MMASNLRVAGTLALALAALAGCSGDEESLSPGSANSFVKEGDAIIASRVDAARLAAVVRISGNLIVRPGEDLDVVNLPRLLTVDGSVVVEDLPARPVPFRLELPGLTRVGQNLTAQRANTLVAFELPAVRSIGGHLAVDKAGKVSVNAPLLAAINGDLRVVDGGLAALALPALARIGGNLRLDHFGPLTGDAAAVMAAAFQVSLPALAVIEGDVKLRSALQLAIQAPLLARIAGDIQVSGVRVGLGMPALKTLGGDLRLERAVLLESDLGALEEVAGAIDLGGLTLEPRGPLALPALARVGADFSIEQSGGLRELALPALARVGGRLRLVNNGDLVRVSVPGPVELPSDLEISGCGATLVVSLPQVAKLGGSLRLIDDGDLMASLPRLREVVGTVRVERTTLKALELPALQAVGQGLEFVELTGSGLELLDLPALKTVGANLVFADNRIIKRLSLPLLDKVGGSYGGHALGSVLVTDNPTLSELDLAVLREVTQDLVVRHNPVLDSERLAPVAAGAVVGGRREICGNMGDLPACP